MLSFFLCREAGRRRPRAFCFLLASRDFICKIMSDKLRMLRNELDEMIEEMVQQEDLISELDQTVFEEPQDPDEYSLMNEFPESQDPVDCVSSDPDLPVGSQFPRDPSDLSGSDGGGSSDPDLPVGSQFPRDPQSEDLSGSDGGGSSDADLPVGSQFPRDPQSEDLSGSDGGGSSDADLSGSNGSGSSDADPDHSGSEENSEPRLSFSRETLIESGDEGDGLSGEKRKKATAVGGEKGAKRRKKEDHPFHGAVWELVDDFQMKVFQVATSVGVKVTHTKMNRDPIGERVRIEWVSNDPQCQRRYRSLKESIFLVACEDSLETLKIGLEAELEFAIKFLPLSPEKGSRGCGSSIAKCGKRHNKKKIGDNEKVAWVPGVCESGWFWKSMEEKCVSKKNAK